MNVKAIIPLVLGLGVGLLAVKFLFDTLQRAKGNQKKLETITVVWATMDIDSFEEITAEKVALKETAGDDLIPSAERLTSLEEVLGRVTAKAIPHHSPVLASMLAVEGTPPGMVGRIPAGFRAVSVKIDEVTGVAYQLQPGDWVDVIVVMDVDTGGRSHRKETIAEVILQRVQVAAIGQAMHTQPSSTGANVKPAKSATLLVAEDDVPKLHLAGTRGKITLSMRGNDDTLTDTPALASSDELFGYGRPEELPPAPSAVLQPAPVPVPVEIRVEPEPEGVLPHSITVYRGSSSADQARVEQVTFESSRSRTVVALSEGPVSRNPKLMGKDRPRSDLLRRPERDRPTVDETVREPVVEEGRTDTDHEEVE